MPEPGSSTGATPPSRGTAGGFWSWIANRELPHYPRPGPRHFYLAIVVVASIVLWYQYFLTGSLAQLMMVRFHMTFLFYVVMTVGSQGVGVLAASIGQITDRIGRCWVIITGLGIVTSIQLFGFSHVNSQPALVSAVIAVGLFEGVILVATPALVRDFTPQLGRASAMGFWTLGPVAGLLVATELTAHTLGVTSGDWQREYIISGVVGLIVFGIALLFLRELSPQIRDQLMVTERDKVLVELKAKGLDIEAALRSPWRQMARFDVVSSAVASNVLLIIYYTATAFFPIYLVTVFLKATLWSSLPQANALLAWVWGADCIALVLSGILSDMLKVRKPFMMVGAVGMLVFILLLISHTGHVTSGYYTIVWVCAGTFFFQAMCSSTWMASFTETCEARNPALVATGLSIWGGLLRFTAGVSIFVVAFVATSAGKAAENSYTAMTPQMATAVATFEAGKTPPFSDITATGPHTQIANIGPAASAIQNRYPEQVAIAEAHPADWQAAGSLSQTQLLAPPHAALLAKLEKDVQGFPHTRIYGTTNTLLWMNQAKTQLLFLGRYQGHLSKLLAASRVAPRQWQHWFWICFGGVVFFIPWIFVMKGRWRPSRAREDERKHEAFIERELAKVRREMAPVGAGDAP
ncbi:MAG: MFS transporter [Acidimicrobiales bacterium]